MSTTSAGRDSIRYDGGPWAPGRPGEPSPRAAARGWALAALLVALGGCSDDDSEPGDGSEASSSSSETMPAPEPSPLAGTRWRVVGIAGPELEYRAPALATRYEIVLSDDLAGFSGFDGCTAFEGDVDPAGGNLVFVARRPVVGTGCGDGPLAARVASEREAIERLLFGEVSASVAGSTLELAADDASGLLRLAAVPDVPEPVALEPAIAGDASVGFRPLGAGARAPAPSGVFEVLRDRRALARVLAELGGAGEAIDPPEVDFASRSVLYVRAEEQTSGGVRLEPGSAQRRDGYTDVAVRLVGVGSGCVATTVITTPWLLLELDALAQAVRVDAIDAPGEPCDGSVIGPDGAPRPLPELGGEPRVAFEPLGVDATGDDAPSVTVIGDRETLAGRLPDDPANEALLDSIDFAVESVVDAVFGFAPSLGFEIGVVDARGTDTVVVEVLSTVPGFGCIVADQVDNPRQLARVAAPADRVAVAERRAARPPCEEGA